MTFAAIPWLDITINLMMVVFFIVCLLMVLLILMQRPKQEGLGAAFGANVTDQVFGARTTNVLQRGTVYLASAFFFLSLGLATAISFRNKQTTLIEPTLPAAEAPATPPAPEKSISEEAKEAGQPVPAPVTPAPEAPTPVPAPTPAAETPAPAPAPATETPAQPAAPAEKPAGQ